MNYYLYTTVVVLGMWFGFMIGWIIGVVFF